MLTPKNVCNQTHHGVHHLLKLTIMKKRNLVLSIFILLEWHTIQAQVPLVTYPNGGETFAADTSVLITWSGVPNGDIVGIDYTINNWVNTIWLNTSYASNGSFNWVVPNTPSSQCKVGVFNLNFDGDISDQFFTITGPTSIEETNTPPFVTYPNPIDNQREIKVLSELKLQFKIINLCGQVKQIQVTKENGSYLINLQGVASGLYYLNIENEDGKRTYSKKLILN